MKRPESAAYLVKARQSLKEARVLVANDLAEAAGRAAYLAAYHAAQAFVFDATGKAAKTHSGVRSEFARLALSKPSIDQNLATFLARAYRLKEHADYALGADAGITISDANQAIDGAIRFVNHIDQALQA
jgi:uncharacterized protein (UPF0332 family)